LSKRPLVNDGGISRLLEQTWRYPGLGTKAVAETKEVSRVQR
jgi:hypothetical protein